MPFKPGLELIEASLVDASTSALWAVTFIEGPDREEQFTLRLNSLRDGEIQRREVEVISPLFPKLNNASHEGQAPISLVGHQNIAFRVSSQPDESWIPQIDQGLRERIMPSIFGGAIFPSPDNHLRVFIHYSFGDLMPPVTVSALRLADGFTFSATCVVVALCFGVLKLTSRLLTHVEAMEALKICVPLKSSNELTFGQRIGVRQMAETPRFVSRDEITVHEKPPRPLR